MKKFTILFAALLMSVVPAMSQSASEPAAESEVTVEVGSTKSDSAFVLVADSLLIAPVVNDEPAAAPEDSAAADVAEPIANDSLAAEPVDSAFVEIADSTMVEPLDSLDVDEFVDSTLWEGEDDLLGADASIFMDYVPNPFKDNWELSVGGGVICLFNGLGARDKTNNPFYDATGGIAEISASKWFSPYLGMRLAWTTGYLPFKQYREDTKIQQAYPIGAWHNYVHADLMWDWTSQFGGYNPYRIYDAIPYVHVGMVGNQVNTVTIAGGIGLLNRFHINEHWLINLDVRGTAASAHKFGVALGSVVDIEALVSVTYRFDNAGWKKTVENPYKETLEELRAMNEELDQKRVEVEDQNEKLETTVAQREQERKELAQLVTAITKDTTFYGVPDTMEMTVYYAINSWELSAHEKAHMSTYLRLIGLNDPNYMHIYKVVGSADAGTGAREINEALCRRRAETIKNVLIESGVDPENIRTEIEIIDSGSAQLARASHVVIYPVEKPKIVIPDSINLETDEDESAAEPAAEPAK